MKRCVLLLLLTIGAFIFIGCALSIHYDGPYEGRVIDAESGKPIEGVVVLGVWYTVTVTPGGGSHDYYDAQETVTDSNGYFKIQGLGLKVLSSVEPMNFLIFKAGYEHLGLWPWHSLKGDVLLREKIKWEAAKAIIPLQKLTMEVRIKQATPSRPNIPVDKMKLMTQEINKERVSQGLNPFRIER